MSEGAADVINRELVIIKRRAHSEGEAHHGGVWKIAYADFMTAMMAFFLVMWLINAANEETRSQVASYFNPVKLVDTRTNTKGLQDLDAGADGAITREPVVNRTKEESKGDKKEEKQAAEKNEKKVTEEMLLRDPYAALLQIAGPAEEDEQAPEPKAGALPEKAGQPGQLGGEAYLDPFDPQTWQHATSKGPETSQPPVADMKSDQKTEIATAKESEPSPNIDKTAIPPLVAEARPQMAAAVKRVEPGDKAETEKFAAPQDKAQGEKPESTVDKAPVESVQQDARQIEKEIKTALGTAARGASPQVEVRSTAEGVLISLTDDASFGMFAIASAEPQPVLVSYMEKIGKILKQRPGTIIISGHTDGRPFRSDLYDNWRLSSARAQMAYYMLLRGGVDEKRVERIEGHADRDLKVPGDPNAAENRRIEILLHEVKS